MKLRVLTHSGNDFEVTVKKYNSVELNKQLNNNEIQAIEIGGVIVARFEIKMIVPINEDK